MVDKMSVSPHLIHISNPFISRKKMCFGMFLATSSSSSPQHWQHWNMSTQRDRSEAHCLNPTVEGSVEHCWIFSWCMCPTHCFTFVLAHFGENLLDCRWENIYWNWLLNMRSESVSCFWCFRAKCISQAKPTTKQSTVPLSSWSQSHTLRLFFTVDLFKVSHKQPLLSPHPWTSWTSSSSHESWGFTKRTSPSALTKRYHFARLWTSDLAFLVSDTKSVFPEGFCGSLQLLQKRWVPCGAAVCGGRQSSKVLKREVYLHLIFDTLSGSISWTYSSWARTCKSME